MASNLLRFLNYLAENDDARARFQGSEADAIALMEEHNLSAEQQTILLGSHAEQKRRIIEAEIEATIGPLNQLRDC